MAAQGKPGRPAGQTPAPGAAPQPRPHPQEPVAAAQTTPARRLADVALVLLLAPLALPLFALLALLVRLVDGAPVLHVAERMQTPARAFRLYKLRSMRPAPPGAAPAAGVLGGDRDGQVTPLGRQLRRTRLDELPQLWNILRGDMGFVGPRPPERLYVERCPALYARVLARRPGLTGLATLSFHAHEERLLAACRSPEQTDAVYMRRCVPRKARLDLIWARHSTPCADLWLLGRTFGRVLGLSGRRRGRARGR
jgi:lipopolysaccharide/colanic/teichoic acid biosynthesis glycosyltransferase